MTDDQTEPVEPNGDDLGDRLREGFDSLARAAGAPSPLPDRPVALVPAGPARTTRRVLVAAAVVLVLLVGGAIALVSGGDSDDSQEVAAGATTTPGSVVPTGPTRVVDPPPDPSQLLICPPALLDLTALDVVPVAAEPFELEEGSATSHTLTWEQDGHTVLLEYPKAQRPSILIPSNDEVVLDDGRVVRFDPGETGHADVNPPPDPGPVPEGPVILEELPLEAFDPCPTYGLSVEGEGGREVLLDVAEAVEVSPPGGTVEVPDVVGRLQIEAQDSLARAGLVPAARLAYQREGSLVVIAQEPAAGTVVDAGTKVELTMETPPTMPEPPPPPIVEVDALPIPTDPLVCPISRLQVDDDFRSVPTVHSRTTIEWLQDGGYGGYNVLLTWPNRDFVSEAHATRELSVLDRPALMHGSGDGQNLVYDTGLPGACRFLEIGVYGGPSIPERERRAEALAPRVTFAPPPTGEPPNVTGLTVAAAADRLARAGFIPDWGDERAIGDEPTEVPTSLVTAQELTQPGVVQLTT